jgi:polyhydroxyalkanoate synthase subunit PhaE
MEKNTNPFLNPDWLRLQQQYIDALSSLNPQQTGPGQYHSSEQGWNEALQHWQRSIEQFLPAEAKSLFDNILNQTRLYYSIADNFAMMLKDISAADRQTDDWRTIMASHLGKMKAQFDIDDPHAKSQTQAASWFQPYSLDAWNKAISAASVLPEGLFDNPVQDEIEKLQERLTAIPGIGPSREFQDKIASAILLWKDYQHKSREYQSVLAQLGKLALDRLEQKILGMADSSKKISSLRQVYDLWIDSNEEVFSRFAFHEDHARLYGELVNSLMQYRHKCNEITDIILGAMNLPTGVGMTTVYKRQHQMGQALRDSIDIQQKMEDSFQQLQAELARLRRQMDKSEPAGAAKHGKARPARKKKSAPKPE